MGKILFTFLIMLIIGGATGCSDNSLQTANTAANRASAANSSQQPPPSPIATPTTQPNVLNSTKDSNDNRIVGTSSNSASIEKSNKPNSKSTTAKPPLSATPESTPAPKTEQKDNALFSFPPPKPIGVREIDKSQLLNPEGATTFSQVAKKLAAGLAKGGYQNEKLAYFWNEKDEFAIITAIERVKPDGAPLEGDERWDASIHQPKAHNFAEYAKYLIGGKKVYYRVFAFIVTSKRNERDFFHNASPDFTMAKHWLEKGKGALGEGGDETSMIEDVLFGDSYKCFALLYLFVNHPRLDNPVSIDVLSEEKRDDELSVGVKKDVGEQVKNTSIKFGE